jgi:hypothetical protein
VNQYVLQGKTRGWREAPAGISNQINLFCEAEYIHRLSDKTPVKT